MTSLFCGAASASGTRCPFLDLLDLYFWSSVYRKPTPSVLGLGRLLGRPKALFRAAHLRKQPHELAQQREDDPEGREGRPPAGPGEIVEPDLLDGEAEVLRLCDELGADERALRPEHHRLEDLAPHQLEREVGVAVRPAEEHADEAVVDVRVDRPAEALPRAVVPIR